MLLDIDIGHVALAVALVVQTIRQMIDGYLARKERGEILNRQLAGSLDEYAANLGVIGGRQSKTTPTATEVAEEFMRLEQEDLEPV